MREPRSAHRPGSGPRRASAGHLITDGVLQQPGCGHAQWAPRAELLLGELETDPDARRRHRERAAASGDFGVLVSLAELYAADGCIRTARHLLHQAGRRQNQDAERYLPFLADDPAVAEHAFDVISADAEAGHTDSMAFLGLQAFRNADEDSARYWWTRAAAKRDIIAPLLLNRLHQI